MLRNNSLYHVELHAHAITCIILLHCIESHHITLNHIVICFICIFNLSDCWQYIKMCISDAHHYAACRYRKHQNTSNIHSALQMVQRNISARIQIFILMLYKQLVSYLCSTGKTFNRFLFCFIKRRFKNPLQH